MKLEKRFWILRQFFAYYLIFCAIILVLRLPFIETTNTCIGDGPLTLFHFLFWLGCR